MPSRPDLSIDFRMPWKRRRLLRMVMGSLLTSTIRPQKKAASVGWLIIVVEEVLQLYYCE